MGWVWTAVVVWLLLALPAAVLIGRAIRHADSQELDAPLDVPDDVPIPRSPPPPQSDA